MTAIMLYVLILSCVISAAALVAERAAGAVELPVRPVWLGALLACTAFPFIGLAAGGFEGGAPSAELAAVGARGDSAQTASATEPGSSAITSTSIDWQGWTAWSEWSGWQIIDRTAWPPSTALDGMLAALWIVGSIVVLLVYLAAWLWMRWAPCSARSVQPAA